MSDNQQLDQDAINALLANMNNDVPADDNTTPDITEPEPQAFPENIPTSEPELPEPQTTVDDNQLLDQNAINALLATANETIVEPETTSNITEQKTLAVPEAIPSPPPEIQQTTIPISKFSPKLVISKLKQGATKKVLALLSLLIFVIASGAFIGYKLSNDTHESLAPIEKITHAGITFEEKNFVNQAGLGNKYIINAFIDAGMSVNVVRSTDAWTPLMSASCYRKSDIVKILIDNHAAINLQDKHGQTALMHATAMGAEDIVIMLLENGANPNLQDINGRTALMEAYSKKQAKIAEIIKNAGGYVTNQPLIRRAQLPITNTNLPNSKTIETRHKPINEEVNLGLSKAGPLQIGMSLDDIRKTYSSLTLNEEYIDGTKKSIAKIYLNGQNTPSMKLELAGSKVKIISLINIYDDQFSTDKDITINSTVGEIRKQYPTTELKIINNSLFVMVKSLRMLFEIDVDKNSIPKEWLETGHSSAIPEDTKIQRIILY